MREGNGKTEERHMTEVDDALRKSEERFSGLFNTMSSGVAVYEAVDNGEDFIFQDINPAAERIEAVSREDVIGKRVTEVFPGVRDFGIFEVFQRVWRTGVAEDFPQAIYRDERDPGTWRENRVYRLASKEIVAVYDDVTVRKRAEEELKAANQQLDASNQQLRASELQLKAANQQLDASNQQLLASENEIKKHAQELGERVKELGCFYTISSVVERPGVTLGEILQGSVNAIPPAWQYPGISCARIILGDQEFRTENFRETRWKQASDIIVAGKHTGTLEVYYLEECPELSEGPFLAEERKLLNAITERLGRIIERKQAEEALKMERDKLTAIFESMEDGVYIVNKDYDIQYVNPVLRKQFGSPEGKKCHDYFHDSDNPCVFCKNEEVFAGKTVHWEWTSPKNGKTYDLIDTPMKNSNGSMSKLEIFRDISERKQAERTQKAMNQQLDTSNQQLMASERQLKAANQQLDASNQQIGASNQQLMASEKKFTALSDNMKTGLVLHGADTKILFSNPAASEILGLSKEQLEGKIAIDPAWKFFRENGSPMPLEEYPVNIVLASKTPLQDYILGVNIPGKNHLSWVLVEATPVFNMKNDLSYVSITFQNITERKQAEQRMKESEERSRAVLAAIPDLTIVLDTEGRYRDFFAIDPAMLGAPPEQILGKTVHEIMPAENANAIQEVIDQALSTGTLQHYEYSMEVGGVPHWYAARAVKFRFQHSDCVLWSTRDITQRKRAEEALWHSNARNEAILCAMPEMMFVLTGDGTYIDFKAEASEELPVPPDEIIGKNLSDIGFPEETLRLILKEIEDTLETRDIHSFTYDLMTPVGKRHYEARIVPFEKDMVLATVRNITERKHAEEQRLHLERQIQHAQKLESLGVLAGGIAHDFNNLLMGMLGNADLALSELSPMSPAKESIKHIETAAMRAAELAKQMLAYSGKGKFVVEDIHFNVLIEEMTHLLGVSKSKNVVLKYNLASTLPLVKADATQMRQVVMNLITNASEAIEEKSGVVSISTGVMECDCLYLQETYLDEGLAEGRYAFVEISDTGCGMDKEILEKIFDPFFTTKFTGRGLGMAAILGIIRGHNGAIKIYSELGKGTTVKVLFPALDHNIGSQEGKEIPTEEDEWTGCGTVLLVDDEKTVLTVGKAMLKKYGITVLTAEDGRLALDVFREHKDEISCVLLDLTMPHMGGEETFRELRRIRGDVKVILSSGYNEQEVTNRFAGKGLAGFIQKPYRREDLMKVLRRAVDGEESNQASPQDNKQEETQ